MATTRIIPMHISKGKTIAQCLRDRIDYGKNPEKTNDGELVALMNVLLKLRIRSSFWRGTNISH